MSYRIQIQGWASQGSGLWRFFDARLTGEEFPANPGSPTKFKSAEDAKEVVKELRKVFVNVRIVEVVPETIRIVDAE